MTEPKRRVVVVSGPPKKLSPVAAVAAAAASSQKTDKPVSPVVQANRAAFGQKFAGQKGKAPVGISQKSGMPVKSSKQPKLNYKGPPIFIADEELFFDCMLGQESA